MNTNEYTEKLKKLNAIVDSASNACAWAVADGRMDDAQRHANRMREAHEAAMALIKEQEA